jgi:hypothetical protein
MTRRVTARRARPSPQIGDEPSSSVIGDLREATASSRSRPSSHVIPRAVAESTSATTSIASADPATSRRTTRRVTARRARPSPQIGDEPSSSVIGDLREATASSRSRPSSHVIPRAVAESTSATTSIASVDPATSRRMTRRAGERCQALPPSAIRIVSTIDLPARTEEMPDTSGHQAPADRSRGGTVSGIASVRDPHRLHHRPPGADGGDARHLRPPGTG